MKKNILISLTILTFTLLFSGCVRTFEEDSNTKSLPSSLLIKLDIQSDTAHMQTRATMASTDNENKIDNLYLVFYQPSTNIVVYTTKTGEAKLIDPENNIYGINYGYSSNPLIQDPDIRSHVLDGQNYDIVVIANTNYNELPKGSIPAEQPIKDFSTNNNIYKVQNENGVKVNKPNNFTMIGKLNKTINLSTVQGRMLGEAQLYRLASKLTCNVNIINTENFSMVRDESKPIEIRLFNGVYNSSFAMPDDETSLPRTLKRTLPGATPDQQLKAGEYLPLTYTKNGQNVKQALYTYLWPAENVPEIYVRIWLKKDATSTESTPYYYRIPIKNPGNGVDKTPWEIKRNTWYDITLTISTLGQLNDEEPMPVNGSFIITDWVNDQKYYNYRIYGYRYIDIPQKEVTLISDYNPNAFKNNFSEAQNDEFSFTFDSSLPDIQARVINAFHSTDEKAYKGVANGQVPLSQEEINKIQITVDNDLNTCKVSDPFPGFFQYQKEFDIELYSAAFPNYKDVVHVIHLPRYSVAMNNLIGIESNLRRKDIIFQNPREPLSNFASSSIDNDIRAYFYDKNYMAKGKQMFIYKVVKAPNGATLGYPAMDELDFYRFENIEGFNQNSIDKYNPANISTTKLDLPPVKQKVTRIDAETEKMVSPKFIMSSMLGSIHPIRYYSAFNNNVVATPRDKNFYKDIFRSKLPNNGNNPQQQAFVLDTYKIDQENGLYKNNIIYKPENSQYAYVNTALLETNMLLKVRGTAGDNYWEILRKNSNYQNDASQSKIGIDALNMCAQYWEDVKLPDGSIKRITDWRLPTKAELDLIASIQWNQNPRGAWADDNSFKSFLFSGLYYYNNGYCCYDTKTNEYGSIPQNVPKFCRNPWGFSYDFAYPGENGTWLGFYAWFVRCVHDVDRFEAE